MSVIIRHGDCREVLKTLPDKSVHCCVTSPPYFGLRDYGHAGQIGLEATPDAFVAEMVAVFREVRRVLRDDGTLWLNLGDSYNSGPSGGLGGSTLGGGQKNQAQSNRAWRNGSGRADGVVDDRAQRNRNGTNAAGLKPKDLIGIPWRVAFALQADGWYLRQDIIWSKPNPMPESVTDRCTKAHEYIFLMSKSARYYYDAKAIAEAAEFAGKTISLGEKSFSKGQAAGANVAASGNGLAQTYDVPDTRNKRSVWSVSTQPYSEAHFATFPPDLIEPCIKAGCPKFTCGSCGTALDSRYEKARSNTNGKTVQDLQMVRRKGGTGPSQPGAQLLQQGLCLAMDSEEPEHIERVHNNIEGLPDADETRASERDAVRLCDGAPLEHRSGHRSSTTPNGSSSPQRRESDEQRSVQSGGSDKSQSRQTSKAQDRNDNLSSLRGEDNNLALCPSCGASLNEVGVNPGIVLDCFGGAGTTGLVADRLGRDAILIELNPEYAAMAQRRIEGDAGMFAEVGTEMVSPAYREGEAS